MRAATIGSDELWLDEAFSFHVARLPDMVAALRLDNTPPLYYVLLRAWMRLAGTSESALRMLSALFGTAAVGAAIWAGRTVFDRAAALWTGLVVAAAPMQIYYAQEARSYALLVLLLLLECGLLWRATERDRRSDWAWASLVAALALYTHALSAFAVLAAASVVLFRSKPGQLRRCALALAAAAALFAPWLVFAAGGAAQGRAGLAWVRNIWEQTPPLAAVPRSLELFALGSHAGLVPLWLKRFGSLEFSGLLRLCGIAALVFLGARLVLRARRDRALSLRVRWVAIVLFGPLAALWLISWTKPLYAVGRYDTIAYPAFALLAGAALAETRRSLRSGAAFCGVALALWIPVAAKLAAYYAAPPEHQAAPTAAFLRSETRAGDVVVFAGLRGLPVLYYLDRLGLTWSGGYCRAAPAGAGFYCRMFPRATEQTPAAADPSRAAPPPEAVREEVDDLLSHLAPGAALRVAFESASFEGGHLRVPETDALLVRELERRGCRRIVTPQERELLMAEFRR